MTIAKQNIKDIEKIMSMDKAMIRLLPLTENDLELLNPWIKQLPDIFRELKLKSGQIVLDIPCGKGGVSIPLAQKYGVKVLGRDILEHYTEIASKLASKKGIKNLCNFKIEDIRKVVKQKNICDLLLWIAAPHIWKTSRDTIKELRNCVRDNGTVLIADAYLYKPTKKYENYETLESTNNGYCAFGDEIVNFIDYKASLWAEDYDIKKKSTKKALKKIKSETDKTIIRKYLESLDKEEKSDTKYLGLGIWVIKIKKPNQNKLEKYLQTKIFPDLEKSRGGFDKIHTIETVDWLKKIIDHNKNLKLDKTVLLIAAYAHDWGYSGLFKVGEVMDLEKIKSAKKAHMIIGAKRTAKLLKDDLFTFLTKDQKIRCTHLVAVHDKKFEIKDTDELVLMEADMLSFLQVKSKKPVLDPESNKKAMEDFFATRLPKFITDYGKTQAQKLIKIRKEYFDRL